MAIKAGLVGLPNVGKSTLFNALTKSSIPAENYPFCTLDPHLAITNVPDERLTRLADVFKSGKMIPTTVSFVDIAGLVQGASKGEGLGNQFLGHIMEVDLILHVVRCFDKENITHVHNRVDPVQDFEIINTELMIKDLESVEKRIPRILATLKKQGLSTNEIKALEKELALLESIKPLLEAGNHDGLMRAMNTAQLQQISTIPLLSAKKILIIANINEADYEGDRYLENPHYKAVVKRFGADKVIPISAQIEAELAQLSDHDAKEMMESLNISHRGLDGIISQAYHHLGLITFFTCGPKEAHAWSIPAGTKVPQAAGTIHSDLERGFICAEVYHCTDIFAAGSESSLRTQGKIRTEGKEYIVQDGDLLNIRFNV